MTTLLVLLWALGLLVLLPSLYLATLALLSGPTPPPPESVSVRFDIVVPAHDEERELGRTLERLGRADYPKDRRRILVVADNCHDRTAAIAAAHGARVLVRDDPERVGKGWALELAFAESRRDGFADAVVVVDADTLVAPNLLRAFAARIAAGADAVQGHYAVGNPQQSWRTRLMALAFALFHGVRSLGRERLGLSAGLRGNGMAFTRRLLERVPYDAHSLVEDVEYGLDLGLAGVRVVYAAETTVSSDMPADGRTARSQRSRWEKGRFELLRSRLPRVLGEALRRRDRVLLDLGADLLVPPLAELGLLAFLGLVGSLALVAGGHAPALVVLPWGASFLLLTAYVGRGLALSGLGWSGVGALAGAPVYLLWKLALVPARWSRRSQAWVRTVRKGEAR